MRVKNPIGFVPRLEALPDAPADGAKVDLVIAGQVQRVPVYYDGAVWRSSDPAVLFVTADGDLVVGNSAVVVDGVAVQCDVQVHDRCNGVVQAIVDGMAVVRRMGLLYGYEGLTPGKALAVGQAAGSVVSAPFPAGMPSLMRLGYVYDATTILVDVLERVGLG